jgi:hypothetical protein
VAAGGRVLTGSTHLDLPPRRDQIAPLPTHPKIRPGLGVGDST